MRTTTFITALIATFLPFSPVTVTAIPTTTQTDTTLILPRANIMPECTNNHLPTTTIFRQALNQYCTSHFPHAFHHKETLTITYTVTDYRGYPVKWLLKTQVVGSEGLVGWSGGDNRGGSTFEITQQYCKEAFGKFLDGEDKWRCKDPNGGTSVKGGRFDASAEVRGRHTWVETRKRVDDKFLPPPPGSED